MPEAEVNGVKLNYSVEGEGEPLVMIIGLGSDRSNWRLQLPAFKKHYRVVTFDNRGSGKSSKPKGPYTIRMMADDTAGLMDCLSIGRANVVGVSMGGMIAQELAINHPERVKKLVLGCTFASSRGASGISPEVMKTLENYRGPPYDAESLRKIAAGIIDLTFNRGTYRMIFLPLMKAAIKAAPMDGFGEQLDAILAHDAEDRLGGVTASTLVMAGADDRVIKPTSSDVIAKLIPNARLVKVAGGSHGFSGEMGDRFNSEVLNFLRS